MTLFVLSALGVLARGLTAGATDLVGAFGVMAASIAAVLADPLAWLCGRLCRHHVQLFALEFSLLRSSLVTGPFEALFPPPHR
jgi:hypothetical protein